MYFSSLVGTYMTFTAFILRLYNLSEFYSKLVKIEDSAKIGQFFSYLRLIDSQERHNKLTGYHKCLSRYQY